MHQKKQASAHFADDDPAYLKRSVLDFFGFQFQIVQFSLKLYNNIIIITSLCTVKIRRTCFGPAVGIGPVYDDSDLSRIENGHE